MTGLPYTLSWIKAELKRFRVDTRVDEKTDFRVISDYEIAKKNFTGELNPVSTFIRRQIKVEPHEKGIRQPILQRKSSYNHQHPLKIIREIPTVFPKFMSNHFRPTRKALNV